MSRIDLPIVCPLCPVQITLERHVSAAIVDDGHVAIKLGYDAAPFEEHLEAKHWPGGFRNYTEVAGPTSSALTFQEGTSTDVSPEPAS